MTEHKHRAIIEEWLKDTSQPIYYRYIDHHDDNWLNDWRVVNALAIFSFDGLEFKIGPLESKAMTNPYRHKHADLIHELAEDTRLRVRDCRTNHISTLFGCAWLHGREYEIVRPDPHAEMRAKFEAEPDRYKIRWRYAGNDLPNNEWRRWDMPGEGYHKSHLWWPHIECEIEEIPHWELQAKVRNEPGKWDVEFSEDGEFWFKANPYWDETLLYRLVPRRKMLTIIGVDGKAYEFPEPMQEAPEEGTEFWYIAATEKKVFADYWTGEQFDIDALKFNNYHRTREDAIACRNAWILARGGKLPEGEE